MMRITALGCGGSGGVPLIGGDWGRCNPANPRNRRRRVSVLVETGGAAILIDTAPDLREQLLDAGVTRIDAVLFTHDHADHVHGIDDLRFIRRGRDQPPMPAYGTAETLAALDRRFGYIFRQSTAGSGGLYRPFLEPRAIDGPFEAAGIPVLPFPQDHGYGTQTTGFRLGGFAYSTDLVELTEEAVAALAGLDLWVVDCLRFEPHPTHAHFAKTLGWIERLRPKRAVLTHLNHTVDYDDLAARCPPGVEPAYDGLVLEIPDRRDIIFHNIHYAKTGAQRRSSDTAPDLPAEPPIERLRAIMAKLRGAQGCPWDRAQTFASIAPYTIEEAYEVADAIERGDLGALKEELGDLLLQVVFHARMAEELGQFDLDAVANAIADKLVRRHPHVFAEEQIRTAAEQTRAWEEQKASERAASAEKEGRTPSALDGIAANLPALMRALKLQRRAARIGLDWPQAADIRLKIEEELDEISRELPAGSVAKLEEEIGDLLFSCVNLARRLEVDPDAALRGASRKFERRFRRLEALLATAGRRAEDLDLAALEALWQQAKDEEANQP